jgi:hypothetical protein
MSSERSNWQAAVPAKGISGREAVAAALAAGAEAIVVLLTFSADVPLAVPLQLHAATVAAVALILFGGRGSDEDLTVAALMFLVILLAGPAGAIASLTALAFVGHAGADPGILRAWYTRLSRASGSLPSSELTDHVNAGRVIDTNAATPARFEDVVADGTLAEKQAALGLMARRFHTDFAPALEAALRSPEPVVRVQAAAVVARVRGDLKARIKTLLHPGEPRPPIDRVTAAAELVRLAGCSLVDRTDAEKCRRAASEALHVVLVTGHDVVSAASLGNREAAPMIERFLVANGRFRDFRVSRRIHALVLDRGYRVRSLKGSLAV